MSTKDDKEYTSFEEYLAEFYPTSLEEKLEQEKDPEEFGRKLAEWSLAKGFNKRQQAAQETAAVVTELLEVVDGLREHLSDGMRERAELVIEQPKLFEVQQALGIAAEAILALPIEEWSGWFTYLMELVDTGDAGFEFILEVERESINNRLETGRW